jgi:hypothetical protein
MVVRLAASTRLYKLSGIQPSDAVTIAPIRDPNDEESILKHNTHQNRKRSYQVHIQSTREAPIINHQSSIINQPCGSVTIVLYWRPIPYGSVDFKWMT